MAIKLNHYTNLQWLLYEDHQKKTKFDRRLTKILKAFIKTKLKT